MKRSRKVQSQVSKVKRDDIQRQGKESSAAIGGAVTIGRSVTMEWTLDWWTGIWITLWTLDSTLKWNSNPE